MLSLSVCMYVVGNLSCFLSFSLLLELRCPCEVLELVDHFNRGLLLRIQYLFPQTIYHKHKLSQGQILIPTETGAYLFGFICHESNLGLGNSSWGTPNLFNLTPLVDVGTNLPIERLVLKQYILAKY